MKALKVGIVASGMMAKNHVDALRRIPGVEVAAIADPYAKNLAQIAGGLGIENVYTSYQEMCGRQEIDVLHNCTPNHEHFAVNRYAIEHNIAIYSEKPLAVTVGQAEDLCALLQKNRVPNGVNFNYRSNAMVREMRARIRNGDTGKPLLVHGSYLQDWLMYETDYNWRLDSSRGGPSRTVADIGSHWFDTAQLILESRIVAVYARLLTVYPQRLRPASEHETFTENSENMTYEKVDIDTEDAGMILLQFENGIFGSLVLSQISGGYKNALEIGVDCSKYSMRWNQEEADHLFLGDREHGVNKTYAAAGNMTGDANRYAALPGGHPAGWADALHNNIGLFYQAVRDHTFESAGQEYATFEDAAYIMKIVDACLRSSAENRWIHV